jgi:hypothetical protein
MILFKMVAKKEIGRLDGFKELLRYYVRMTLI